MMKPIGLSPSLTITEPSQRQRAPKFGAHPQAVIETALERADELRGDARFWPVSLKPATLRKSFGFSHDILQDIDTATNPDTPEATRDKILGTLLAEQTNSPQRAAHLLLKLRDNLAYHQAQGNPVTLNADILTGLINKADAFEYERGRGALIEYEHNPTSYGGPLFPPEQETAFLKLMLNNNQNDQGFAKSLVEASDDLIPLVIEEAHWIPNHQNVDAEHLIMEKLTEAEENEQTTDLRQKFEERVLARLNESYPVQVNRSCLPQVGDGALSMLLELRKEKLGWPSLYQNLMEPIFADEFVFHDGTRQETGDNKRRTFEDLTAHPFEDSRLEATFLTGMVDKAHNLTLIAKLWNYADQIEKAALAELEGPAMSSGYSLHEQLKRSIGNRVDGLLDELPPSLRPGITSARIALDHVLEIQNHQTRLAETAWEAFGDIEAELPAPLSQKIVQLMLPHTVVSRGTPQPMRD